MEQPGAAGDEREPESARPILIADDDEQLASVLVRMLRRHGYAAVAVQNGRAALKLIERQSVALVITDVFMPDFDGLELIGALRKVSPRPPLVAISGGLSACLPDALNIAAVLGAERVLGKPFEPSQLLQCVRELLGPAKPGGSRAVEG